MAATIPTLRDLGKVADGRIRKRWPTGVAGGPVIKSAHSKTKGLDNPRVLCYRNAVLQCLLHIPEFFNYLCRHDRCNNPGDNCVFCALRSLALSYWSTTETKTVHRKAGKGRKTNPTHKAGTFPQALVADLNTAMNQHTANSSDTTHYGFLQNSVTNNVDINASGQQDAHEYFVGICNMLKFINNDFLHSITDSAGVATPVENKAVDRLFQVVLKRSWKCADCGAVSVSAPDENFGMQLPMGSQSTRVQAGRISMAQYLYDFLATEDLTGVRCDAKCGGKAADRKRICKIAVAPEILVIQLKRMDPDVYTGQLRKVFRHVHYDEFVDLSAHTEKSAPLRYQFTGVVFHQGASLDSGHYIANVRCQNGVDFAEANDLRVKEVDKGDALRDRQRFQSYLLMYQKVGGKMAKCI